MQHLAFRSGPISSPINPPRQCRPRAGAGCPLSRPNSAGPAQHAAAPGRLAARAAPGPGRHSGRLSALCRRRRRHRCPHWFFAASTGAAVAAEAGHLRSSAAGVGPAGLRAERPFGPRAGAAL